MTSYELDMFMECLNELLQEYRVEFYTDCGGVLGIETTRICRDLKVIFACDPDSNDNIPHAHIGY